MSILEQLEERVSYLEEKKKKNLKDRNTKKKDKDTRRKNRKAADTEKKDDKIKKQKVKDEPIKDTKPKDTPEVAKPEDKVDAETAQKDAIKKQKNLQKLQKARDDEDIKKQKASQSTSTNDIDFDKVKDKKQSTTGKLIDKLKDPSLRKEAIEEVRADKEMLEKEKTSVIEKAKALQGKGNDVKFQWIDGYEKFLKQTAEKNKKEEFYKKSKRDDKTKTLKAIADEHRAFLQKYKEFQKQHKIGKDMDNEYEYKRAKQDYKDGTLDKIDKEKIKDQLQKYQKEIIKIDRNLEKLDKQLDAAKHWMRNLLLKKAGQGAKKFIDNLK
jgi:hypothetical protein